MPEGPECTTVAVQLHSILKNAYLTDVSILSGRYLKTLPEGFERLSERLPLQILGVRNKGKFIYMQLERDWNVFITLGMSGSFKISTNPYARVQFDYLHDTGEIQVENRVFYSDMRNFGTLKFVQGQDVLEQKLASIGPDMLNAPCSEEQWLNLCERYKRKSLVNFLMTQSVVSGVGNIYKSESLFLARLHPARTVSSCSQEELLELYRAVLQVLKIAYETGGSTIQNYSDVYNSEGKYARYASAVKEIADARLGKVMVYGQKTDPYGNLISRITLDDKRTTHYSPVLQK
jgi:formamidopyrimidine-DNA glycosylase